MDVRVITPCYSGPRMFFLALYIVRIFLDGLLSSAQANAAFVACGPPGFTAAALILLGRHARNMSVLYLMKLIFK